MQFQNQEQLLEEARRDLDMYKKAFFDTERAKRDLEEMFEQEKQVLNNEIRQLKVRLLPPLPRVKREGVSSSPATDGFFVRPC